MRRTEIGQIFKYPDIYIDIRLRVDGWVKTVRESKNFGFIELSDGSCLSGLQVFFERGALPNYQEIVKLVTGSSLSVIGTLVKSPGGGQAFELRAKSAFVITPAPQDYPLQKKRHSPEFLRGMAHLRARTSTFSAVFRVRSQISFAIHRFFQERGFVCVHTPIITASDSEGAGEMFRVTTLGPNSPAAPWNGGDADYSADFFGKRAGLTVSGQLEAEAFAHAFGKVYAFGPAFRAENSNTPRHAAEFWMIEPEVAFADLADNMDLAEDLVKYIIEDLFDSSEAELSFLNGSVDKDLTDRLLSICKASFARITYTEAIGILERNNSDFEYKAAWGSDLQTEHERFLTEKELRGPVFVTDYPKEIKAFYMRQNDDGRTVAAMDLLVPGIGELIGGSQREERHGKLESRLRELGMETEPYRWYMDLRRFGGVWHSGFGLGFERAVMYMTGITNIRDVLPFPRTAGNAEF
jgi:asparaginyl-tRNA synthetase